MWIISPEMPGWWPIGERWWLPGDAATGVSQICSGLVALGLIVWSFRRFHDDPDAVAEVRREASTPG